MADKTIHELERVSNLSNNDVLVIDKYLTESGNYGTRSILASKVLPKVVSSQSSGNLIGTINGIELRTGEVGKDGSDIVYLSKDDYEARKSEGTLDETKYYATPASDDGDEETKPTLVPIKRYISNKNSNGEFNWFEIYPDGYVIQGGYKYESNWTEVDKTMTPVIKFRDDKITFLSTAVQNTGNKIYADGSVHYISYNISDNTLKYITEHHSDSVSELIGFNYIIEGYMASDAVIPTEGYESTEYYAVYNGGNLVAGTGSGGVIDGSKYLLSNDSIEYITDVTIDTTGTLLYTVENDCQLYIETPYKDYIIWNRLYLYINEVDNPIWSLDDSHTGGIYNSTTIPVKSGSKIYAKFLKSGSTVSNCAFKFIEYKLNSLNPQLAFPDWDVSKAKTINSGDTIPDNGWILCNCTGSGYGQVLVNNIIVAHSPDGYTNSSEDYHSMVVPVSKNDVVTYYRSSVTFYPAKSVSQSNDQVYLSPDTDRHLIEWISVDDAGFSSSNNLNLGVNKRTYYSKTYIVTHDCQLVSYIDWNTDTSVEGTVALQYLNSSDEWVDIAIGVITTYGSSCNFSCNCKKDLQLRVTSSTLARGISPDYFKISFSELY